MEKKVVEDSYYDIENILSYIYVWSVWYLKSFKSLIKCNDCAQQ